MGHHHTSGSQRLLVTNFQTLEVDCDMEHQHSLRLQRPLPIEPKLLKKNLDFEKMKHQYSSTFINRLSMQLKMLTTDADVQSYFHYEGSKEDEDLKQFCIYGYLLPNSEPYKNGSYRVRIILSPEFPFKPPDLQLLTYIYHPAIQDDELQLSFCNTCCSFEFKPGIYIYIYISDLIKHHVDVIDQRDFIYKTCTFNYNARELYNQDKVRYEEEVLKMVRTYAIPRSN